MEDDEDKVLRRTMRATSASALQAQAANAAVVVDPYYIQCRLRMLAFWLSFWHG